MNGDCEIAIPLNFSTIILLDLSKWVNTGYWQSRGFAKVVTDSLCFYLPHWGESGKGPLNPQLPKYW